MPRVPFSDTILVSDGDGMVELVPGAKIEVFDEATGTVRQNLFSSDASVTPLDFVTTDAFGRFNYFVAPGRYRQRVLKAGVIDREEIIQGSDPSTATSGVGGLVDIASEQTITGTKNFSTITAENISVTGNTTLSEILGINDNIITLNADVTSGTPTEDVGFEVNRGGSAKAQLLWNETSDEWQAGTAGNMQAILRGTTGSFTGGSLLFAGSAGALDQNNSKLFWDNTLFSLRIGTNTGPTGVSILSSGQVVAFRGEDNNVDVTNKVTAFALSHRTNAEEAVALIYGQALSTGNIVNIGGGLNTLNAASQISLYTAANTTTVTGTERARIDSTGKFTIFGDFEVQGTTTTVNATNLEITDKNILVNKGGTITTAQTGAGVDVEGDGFIHQYLRLDSDGDWAVASTKGTSSANATGLVKIALSNPSGQTVNSITGTSNQIVASSPDGDVTLSLPQDIHTGASPTFVGLTLSGSVLNTHTIPAGTDTFVLLSATQTLLAKTLTTPVVNDPVLALEDIADPGSPGAGRFWLSTTAANTLKYADSTPSIRTLVDLSLTQTLTNKTLTTPTIGDFSNASHDHSDTANGGTIRVGGGNGSFLNPLAISEEITLNTGAAFTDSTADLLPANSLILGITAIITTTITTATTWRLGDATVTDRFSSDETTLTLGTIKVGLNHQKGNVISEGAGPTQISAAKLRVTLDGNPGGGAIRVVVYYLELVPPTA